MAADPFERWDVSAWRVADAEPQGADEKVWLADPADRRWLWKPVTIPANRHRQGEDWAEKVAAELADVLALPHARIELASRNGREGLVSLDLRPPEYERHSGGVLLSTRDATYRTAASLDALRPEDAEAKQLWRTRPGHSIAAIKDALTGYDQPPDCHLPDELDAFDVFTGYLILDAWLSNRDRHDENWAVLTPRSSQVSARLCGTFDHAGSLGYQLLPDKCARLARDDAEFARFRRGATAHRLENDGAPRLLIEVAIDALTMASSAAQAHWVACVERLEHVEAGTIVSRIPVMSDPARTFAVRLLEANGRGLLDECRRRARS